MNTDDSTHIYFFHLVLTDDFYIQLWTNLYVQQFIANIPTSYYDHPFVRKALTVKELKIFLDLTFNMGLAKTSYAHTGPPTSSITCQFINQ